MNRTFRIIVLTILGVHFFFFPFSTVFSQDATIDKHDINEIFRKAKERMIELEVKIEEGKRLAKIEAKSKQIAELNADAELLMSKGDFKRAKVAYENILKIYGGNPDLKEYVKKTDIEVRREEAEKLRLKKEGGRQALIEKLSAEKQASDQAKESARQAKLEAQNQKELEKQSRIDKAAEAKAEREETKRQAELERAKAKESARQAKLDKAKAKKEEIRHEKELKQQKKLEEKQKIETERQTMLEKGRQEAELQAKAREEEALRKIREEEEGKLRDAKEKAKKEAERRVTLEEAKQKEAQAKVIAEQAGLAKEISENEKLEQGQEKEGAVPSEEEQRETQNTQDISSLKAQADQLYKESKYEEAEVLYIKARDIAKEKREELIRKQKAESARQRLEKILEKQ